MAGGNEFECNMPAAQKVLEAAKEWLDSERNGFLVGVRAASDTLTRLNSDDSVDIEDWRQLFVEAVAMYKSVKANWARLQSFDGEDQVKMLGKKLKDISPQASGRLLADFVDDLRSIPADFADLNEQYNATRRRFSHDRVIFVDIETAFSNFRFWVGLQQEEQSPASPEREPDMRLDPSSVGLLVRLCVKANAKLVLTSSWRKSWPDGRHALVKALIAQGFKRDIWHPEWMLPVSCADGKWSELPKWLNWSSNSVALVIAGERPPADAMPLLARKASLLLIDGLDGFGGRDYFRALEFFGAEDADRQLSMRASATCGLHKYPTLMQRA